MKPVEVVFRFSRALLIAALLLVTLPIGYLYLTRQLARHAYRRPAGAPGPLAVPTQR